MLTAVSPPLAPSALATESPEPSALAQVSADVRARTRVAVVGDDAELRTRCADALTREGYQVTSVVSADAAVTLTKQAFHVVLLDASGGGLRGPGAVPVMLSTALRANRSTLAIAMVPAGTAVRAALIDAGAWDCLPVPFSATHLTAIVGRAAYVARDGHDATARHTTIRDRHVTLLGTSSAFRAAMEVARKVAATDVPVVITGERGSGKALLAEYIHAHSRRASRPFALVSCAALPAPLLEDELFGQRRAGARAARAGMLDTANGGTIHLDGLTEMPAPVQAKLLRLLEEGVATPSGAPDDVMTVNVRITAATSDDPETAVRAGSLREDLFYRLRVVEIHLPPLRARGDDIVLLAEHFLQHYWEERGAGGGPRPLLSDGALEMLRMYTWPGNVTELRNTMRHVATYGAAGAPIDAAALGLAAACGDALAAPSPPLSAHILEMAYHAARDRVVAQFEVQYLSGLLERAGGNMSEAARIAGVDRTTLYRLMERHGLRRTAQVGLVPRHAGWVTPRSAATQTLPGDADADAAPPRD
jgi:DNA-binding NtrC family response regulator